MVDLELIRNLEFFEKPQSALRSRPIEPVITCKNASAYRPKRQHGVVVAKYQWSVILVPSGSDIISIESAILEYINCWSCDIDISGERSAQPGQQTRLEAGRFYKPIFGAVSSRPKVPSDLLPRA